jgi:plastocyanin
MLVQGRRPASHAFAWLTVSAVAAALLATGLLAAPRVDAAETVTVDISGFAFQPGSVTIQVGDTVTWTNNDSVAHTATSVDDPGLFDGEMEIGESFSFTFSEAGSFDYICEFHPTMEGTVVVQAAGASAGASQLPDGALSPGVRDDAPPAAVLGMGLIALALLAGSAVAFRRARPRF